MRTKTCPKAKSNKLAKRESQCPTQLNNPMGSFNEKSQNISFCSKLPILPQPEGDFRMLHRPVGSPTSTSAQGKPALKSEAASRALV